MNMQLALLHGNMFLRGLRRNPSGDGTHSVGGFLVQPTNPLALLSLEFVEVPPKTH